MKLSEFIQNTLSEIYKGCVDSNENEFKQKVIANDVIAGGITRIDFDIMVTTQSETSDELGGKINILEILKIGGKESETNTVSNANRIKFNIPLYLPNKAVKSTK